MAALVDTSALLAFMDADDGQHGPVRSYITREAEALIVPVTVLPEADYMVSTRLGQRLELVMLEWVASGAFGLEGLTLTDLHRCIQLIEQYADGDIGLVDASIVAIAERLRITRILTLDRRHFGVIRPRHCSVFDLLP